MNKLAFMALLLAVGCDDSDSGEGGILEIQAGSGLSGGGMSESVTLAVDFTKVARAEHTHAFTDLTGTPTAATTGAACTGTQKVTGIDVSTGKVTCAADVDTDTNTDTDTLGDLSCTGGQIPKWSGTAWACAADATGGGGGAGTVTSITAGAGLTGGTITGSGTLAVDFTQVAMKGEQPWLPVNETQIRFDGSVGIGKDPVEALTVQSTNAQLSLRDKAGDNAAAVILDDTDGEGGIMNLSWQRAGTTLATLFLSAAPQNFLTYQAETLHRFKIGTKGVMLIAPNGNVGIGTEDPQARLEVSDGTGPNATCDGNTWINASSRNAKENIHTFGADDYARVRRWLAETDVVWYRYKDDRDPRARVGLIAEDVPAVLATPDRKGISTADAIGFLTAASKDLQAENARLKQVNQALEARLERLEKRFEAMAAPPRARAR